MPLRIRRLALWILLAGPFITVPVGAGPAAALTPNQASPSSVTPRDLRKDEQHGGHTLARHVGKSDADLAARLGRERNISAASTYTDVTAAAKTVAIAIEQSRRRIESWEARRGPRPNLVLNVQTTGPPLGRLLRRGQRVAEPCVRALVVLRWDERTGDWFVLTSYPEGQRP